MSLQRVASHAVAWVGVFGFWLIVSTAYHPTLLIGTLATAILVAASASVVYANCWLLLPGRFVARRSWWRYTILILTVLVVADLAVVLSIQRAYDWLWGPDPMRFGFGSNLVLDGLFIVVHLIVGTAIIRFGRPARTAGVEHKRR